jgi:hypothetical protein
VAIKIKAQYKESNHPFVLFFDNARIHKTQAIVNELNAQHVLAILNCPYAPELNFCEKFILMHKLKIKERLADL